MKNVFPNSHPAAVHRTSFLARRQMNRMLAVLFLAGYLLCTALPVLAQQRSLTKSAPQNAPTPSTQPGTIPQVPSTDRPVYQPSINRAQSYSRCSVNPSSIPAGQSTNVAFTVDIASGMSSDRLQLYVAKANPGGAPVKMGYFEAERLGRSEYTFALSINEPQPTVLHLQVYLSKQTIAPSTTPISNCDLQVRAGSDDGTKVETGIKIAKFFVDKFKDHKGKHPPDSQDNKPPTLTAGSITLQYPRDWTYHQEVVDSGGPINLRNFENHLSGGVVPSGGAEIDVTDVKSNGETLNSVVLAELGPTRTEDLFVDGHPALRAFYTDLFASDLIYENQAVYVMDGNTIHKFFLSYRSGDSNQDSFVQAFQAIISSAHFAAQ